MPPSRPGFFYFIALFLRRMPSVWLGGVGSAVAALALTAEFGWRVGAAGAVVVAAAAVVVEFALDRRRGIGRRFLFRGANVSPRRLGALVVAMGLIAAMSTAFANRFVSMIQDTAADELRSLSAPPPKKRGQSN